MVREETSRLQLTNPHGLILLALGEVALRPAGSVFGDEGFVKRLLVIADNRINLKSLCSATDKPVLIIRLIRIKRSYRIIITRYNVNKNNHSLFMHGIYSIFLVN